MDYYRLIRVLHESLMALMLQEQEVGVSYFLRCLKRACMVSWLGLGSCFTRSLMA